MGYVTVIRSSRVLSGNTDQGSRITLRLPHSPKSVVIRADGLPRAKTLEYESITDGGAEHLPPGASRGSAL
jgi:hypothetical protein